MRTSPGLSSQITAALEAGTFVLCDRYAFSGAAFTAAKGLSLDWCRMPDVGLPGPDAVLFFEVSPEIARTRGGYGDERYEKEELQARVRGQFTRLAEMCKDSWIAINADRSLEEVEAQVWTHVQKYVGGLEAPLKRVWE
jgi:dTMP kinase